MPQDRFLIAPIDTGLQTNLRPFLIPDDAFAQLENAYVFRGRVRKRFGGLLFGDTILQSRLAINIGTTNAVTGNLTVTVPGNNFGLGQAFSIGAEILTVPANGTPVTLLDTGIPPCVTATYNTTTGQLVIVGCSQLNTPVYFYPADPVMGIDTYETGVSVDSEPIYAFDYQFIYQYNTITGGWFRSGTAQFHGADTNYFWSTSWKGLTVGQNQTAFFVTNFQVQNHNGIAVDDDDPIWQTAGGAPWAAFYPYFAPGGGAPQTGPYVLSAKLILPFQGRLLLFNVIENDNVITIPAPDGTNTWYPQRCRYSTTGFSVFADNAWYQFGETDSAGHLWQGAGYVDCPTDQQIISAEYLKDRLIVYFENSTWELVYAKNDVQPFVWQKINTELGAISTNSIIPFDKVVLGVDNVGIHACNGYNVERTDTKIPDQVYSMASLQPDLNRTAGVRDYYTELVYWAYVDTLSAAFAGIRWPNKVLVYNYRNGSWAVFDDCITAFGNITPQTGFSNNAILAGNQQGFIFMVDSNTSRNTPSLQISKMVDFVGGITLTIADHNITTGDYIAIENVQGGGVLLNGAIFPVASTPTVNTITIDTGITSAGYTGGGTATRVSEIHIISKQYNPYLDKGHDFAINKIDFAVKKTTYGQMLIDYYTSSSAYSTTNNSTILMGTNVLDTFPYATVPFETYQSRLWHSIYFDSQGDCIQLNMYLSPAMMTNPNVAWSDFQLDAMLFYTQPTGRIS